RRRRRRRDPADAARHLLPDRGCGRPPGRGRAAALLRRHGRRLGGAGRRAAGRAGFAGRGGRPLGAGRTAGRAAHGRRGGRPGRFTPAALLDALTAHRAVGWPDAGRLEPGARADLVAVRLDTPRTAGADPAQILLAASGADVDTLVVGGRVVVADGRHVLGDV